jgi:hypothetical protein
MKTKIVISKQRTVNRFFIFCVFLFSASSLLLTHKVFASTLYLSPGSGSYGVGSTITVTVKTNTQSDAVNTAEANISYTSGTLELVSVKQGSTFYLPSPGSPAKNSSTAYFGGGLPSPGYTGNGGTLGVLTFRAKALGNASVSVSSGHVLLNDGNGTESLTGTSGASFTITPPPVAGPVVISSTHPDPNSWYAKSDVDLTWDRPAGAYGYSFDLDQSENSVPDDALDTTVTQSKSYKGLQDGVYYFHIKAKGQTTGFGATTDFRVQIDTQKPLLFDITLVGQSNLNDVSRTPTIQFQAKDESSGIDHYDVLIDGNLVQSSATSPYNFSKLETGPHVIRVIAYDKAGNDRKAELPIIVNGPVSAGFFHQNLSVPIYLLLLMNLLIIILLVILILVLLRRRKPKKYEPGDEVSGIQADIDESLEELKGKINAKLANLSARSTPELSRKEEEIAKELETSIETTRKKVDKKIVKLRKARKKSVLIKQVVDDTEQE